MFSKQESQYLPVSQNDSSISLPSTPTLFSQTNKSDPWRTRFYILLLATLAILFPLTFYTYTLISANSPYCPTHTQTVPGPSTFFSPAYAHVRYIYKRLMYDDTSPKFMGQPRPEMDEAWHDLLSGTLMRFSAGEMAQANATSLSHKDGGYVAGLGVSHNLHCIKRLKQYMHPAYYYPDLATASEEEKKELEEHADHCLEALRLSLMCNADLSIYTLGWTNHSKIRPGVHIPNPNVCVHWEGLHGWMNSRAASLDDAISMPKEIFKGLPVSSEG
jgi:hypothetical protein